MSAGDLDILLIGPIVYSEINDNLRATTTLVVTTHCEGLEDYCDAKEREVPSLMPTHERWRGAIQALDDGEIQIKSLPPEIGLSCSTDTAKYLIFFKDWAILAVCPSTISLRHIEIVLVTKGLPTVLRIQPA
jgi:hypothetical protein